MPSWLRGPGREAMIGVENTPVAGRNGEEEEDGEEKAVEGGRAMDAAGGKVSPRPPQACAHAARPASRSQAPPQPSPAYFRTSFCPDRAMPVEPLGMPAGVAPRRDRQLIEPRVLRAVDVISPRVYASEALQSAPSLSSLPCSFSG